MPMTFAVDHRGPLPCGLTCLPHGGLPDLAVDTSPPEIMQDDSDTGSSCGFCLFSWFKGPHGSWYGNGREPSLTPWYAFPLGKGQSPFMSGMNAVSKLLLLASKSLSQKPGPSPAFPHAPATAGLMLIPAKSLGSHL